MIGTITMNPCIDKTLVISKFCYGGMNRVSDKRADACGKGINVSAVLTQIGVPVKTMGINYVNGADIMEKGLAASGIVYKAVMAEGTVRENMKVLDTDTGITTELNQKGDYVSPETLAEFEKLLEREAEGLDILVITGSVPQGVPENYYRRLVGWANQRGIRTILDAEGQLLLEGLRARPYLIKPNLFEFETAFGLKGRERKDILDICRRILDVGVEVICLSMGGDGAMIVNREEAWMCRPTPIDVKSTQGAGDSLVAGMCAAMEEGLPIGEMLRYGVSAAQGSLIREGTLLCTREDFQRFKGIVKVEKIESF